MHHIEHGWAAERETDNAWRTLERVSDGVLGLAPDWRIVYLNGCAAQILGRRRESLLGRCLWAELPEGIGGPFHRAYTDAMASQRAEHFEAFAPTRGRWFSNHLYPSPDGLTVFFTDITERRQTEDTLRESAVRFRQLADAMPQIVWLAGADGDIEYYNERWHDYTGLTLAQPRARGWTAAVHPEDQDHTRAIWEAALRDGSACEWEYRLRRADDQYRWHLGRAVPMRDGDGRVERWVGTATDIEVRRQAEDERRRAVEALRETNEWLRLALRGGGLASGNVDFTTRRFLHLSDTYKAHFGVPGDAEFTLDTLVEAIHPDDRQGVRATMRQAIEDCGVYEAEYRVVWPDGSVHWIGAHGSPILDGTGRPARMIGVVKDVTARKQAEAERERELREAQERADRDPLTGLWNHRAFHRRLAEEADRAQREGTTLAVAMLDLDNFGFFNKAYGHIVGDQVLRAVAERLGATCRPYDTVARFGGDEFALLLPGVDGASRREVEARLRTDLDGLTCRPADAAVAIPIGISVGVARYPDDAPDRGQVLLQADERLRRAKTGHPLETEADQMRASAVSQAAGFPMLDALVTAVDNKDRYTRRHSEGVMEYSLALARELDLSETDRKTVALAALLHDVGKIGVPDAILRKPAPLTDTETEAVRQHPAMGAALVSTVPGLEDTLDAVRHHHERWDGGGYPAGLQGEETPLTARLLAVADAFSAMTTDRPYRKGIDRERALAILRDGAGTQWDPRCVAAFLSAMGDEATVVLDSRPAF